MSSTYSIRSGSREREANLNRNQKSKSKQDSSRTGSSSASASSSSSSSSSSTSSTLDFSLTTAQYRSLVFSHSLALIPSFLLLLLLLLLAIHSPCHLHALPLLKPNNHHPSSHHSSSRHSSSLHLDLHLPLPSPQDSSRLSSQRCFTILNSGLTYSTLLLASTFWLASYSFSHFSFPFSAFIFYLFRNLKSFLTHVLNFRKSEGAIRSPEELQVLEEEELEEESESPSTTSISILSILIKTSVLECLRLGSLVLSFALVRAQIPRLHGHDRNGHGSLPPPGQNHHEQPWMKDLDHSLQPTDIRFKLALWCSLGWATTEVCFGAYQLFQQLSLYSPSTIFPNSDQDHDGAMNESDFRSREAKNEPPGLKPKELGNPDQDQMSKEESGLRSNHFEALGIRNENQCLSSSSNSPRNYGSTSDPSLNPSNLNPKVIPPSSHSNNSSTSSISLPSKPIQGEESSISSRSSGSLTPILSNLDSRVQSLLLLHKRSELEYQLGTSLSLVPVTLCGLWRVDSIVWNFALTLLGAASITHHLGPIWSGGNGRPHHRPHDGSNFPDARLSSTSSPTFETFSFSSRLHPHLHDPPIFPSIQSQLPIVIFLISVHTVLTSLWKLYLPTLGFAPLTYSSLLIGIGLLVASAAWWQVVV